MSTPLLPLCSVGKQTTRDGGVGAYPTLMLPFYAYGYWFASGQQYTFANSELPQQQGLTENGTRQANTFTKGAGICLSPS
jgi:hypothetical protein